MFQHQITPPLWTDSARWPILIRNWRLETVTRVCRPGAYHHIYPTNTSEHPDLTAQLPKQSFHGDEYQAQDDFTQMTVYYAESLGPPTTPACIADAFHCWDIEEPGQYTMWLQTTYGDDPILRNMPLYIRDKAREISADQMLKRPNPKKRYSVPTHRRRSQHTPSIFTAHTQHQ